MFAPGDVVADRYEIVRALDSGAMGEVFEALHRTLQRRVALKVLRAEVGHSEESMERFSREAQAAAAVGHPNIVDVIDLGVHAGRPFLVMELLKGQSLLARMRGTYPLTVEDIVRVTAQVLSGLASAHALGVIHRDVKPENVFVLAGSELRVKLLDFGVSKFAPSQVQRRAYTREGVVLGTPRYIAPEQWLDASRVDHRADLFSVGVLLYELLTGAFPYPGDNDADLFRNLVERAIEPEPPSRLRADLPPGLDAVVLRALEPMPAMRFPTAQDFLDALRPFGATGIDATDAPPSSQTIPPPAPLSMLAVETSLRRSSRPAPTEGARVASLRSVAWLVLGSGLGVLSAGFALGLRRSPPAPIVAPRVVVEHHTVTVPAVATTARITLFELPPGVVVRVGGVEQRGASFELPRSTTPVAIEVSHGDETRELRLVPDRDQTVVFSPFDLPVEREPERSSRRRRRHDPR